MNKEKTFIDYEEAVSMLPDSETIHTFVNPGVGMLVGADWDRKDILKAFETHRPCLTGPQATAMKHGLSFWDGTRNVFVETKPSCEKNLVDKEKE